MRADLQIIMALLESETKGMFQGDTSGHDIYHLKRTCDLALRLQKEEGGDETVIAAAALLHDVHRIIQAQTGHYCDPVDSLETVRKLLDSSGIALTEQQVSHILHCIRHHEEYGFSSTGQTANDIETRILQDADNLDALGAMGISRLFVFGGANNITLWEPELPLKQGCFDESVQDPSSIHHFYNKLLRLKENMNTQSARKIAESRHQFMLSFLDEFFMEWEGKK